MNNILRHVRVASDLHLEAFLGRDLAVLEIDFLPKHEKDKESILVLAGDICSVPEYLIAFIKQVENRFYAVHFLPGNHEYYRHDFDSWNNQVGQAAKANLTNTKFTTDEVACAEYYDEFGSPLVRIITCTLWGDGGKSLFERAMVGRYLNDFRLIGFQGKHYEQRLFAVSDMMELNNVHRAGIEETLKQEWFGKTVVATHHMPSYSLCHPRFGGDANGGFASDSDYLIEMYKPDVWIHGHTHDTIDTKISDTRIVCNPRGYRGEWSSQFNTYEPKFIDL